MRMWGLIAIAIITMVSCKKKYEPVPSGTDQNTNSSSNMTVLGDKLENPYTVANMKIAYKNVKLRNSSARVSDEEVEIEATHLYIKFKPKSELELGILKQDSSLILYGYPLDYEIKEGGTYYRDPSVPVGMPTYQYCAVRINQILPKEVEHEVLAELYIPDEYKDAPSTNQRKALSEDFVDALVSEAFHIVGMDSAKTISSNKALSAKKGSWRPEGRVAVWDDVTNANNVANGWRGVEGVVVKARRWFTTHPGTTDGNGNYSCNGTFKRDANYSLDWERYDFALREGGLDGANLNGPNQEGNWDVYLNNVGDRSTFHAKVFMAAFHYYYKDIKGLRRPPQNAILKTQMHIRCHNEIGDKNNYHLPGKRFLGLGSAIHIYNKQLLYPSLNISDLYGTTIHELAHSSHWNMSSGGDYTNSKDEVAESWARGVQWELTRMVWNDYRGGQTNVPEGYTQVVIDLIDGEFDSSNNGRTSLSEDNVTGYTIREIEDALLGQRTWNGWKDNIKNKYNNGTENNLDALFAAWN